MDDGSRAYVLTDLIGPVAIGDRVVVNMTAVDLGLGTGGWHVVHWNLSRDEWSQPGGGHVLKLRYTSLQADTGVAEETHADDLPSGLDDLPVVICDLHSQAGWVAAAFAAAAPGRRLVYVMTDSAALPLALSDLMAEVRGHGLVAATVTAGQAFGGDYEAVNVPSGLLVGRLVRADAIVVAPGPGTVGTGTRLGYGSLDATATIDAVTGLGGRAIVAVRYSDADPRARHRGVSHHTRTALGLANSAAWVPYPSGAAPPDAFGGRHRLVPVDVRAIDIDVTSMGRGREEDRDFSAWSAAAGVLAARMLSA
ncbi:MAG: DUF3866 family protein [Actinomycetota bacterium]|nr:DUF3866 family protein [Actinomycetota bacterium]